MISSKASANLSSSRHRPWANLPSEILVIIAGNLLEVDDRVRFRFVCTSWRFVAKPPDLRELPRLLLPHYPDSSDRPFFSLVCEKTTSFQLPETLNKIICGSSFGWLALVDPADSTLSLLNPVTRAHMHLPSPDGFPSYLGPDAPRYQKAVKFIDPYFEFGGNGNVRSGYPWKVSLSNKPSNNNCVVVVLLARSTAFAFCRLRDEKWTVVDTGLCLPIRHVVYLEERFYAFKDYAAGIVFDSSLQQSAMISSPFDDITCNWFVIDRMYAVRTDAEVYLVFLIRTRKRRSCMVFKLVPGGEYLGWSVVSSLGNDAIFLSDNHSSMISAESYTGFKRNCIYFNGRCASFGRLRPGVQCIDVYDMGKNEFQALSCQSMDCPIEYLGNYVWVAPRNATWFAPSLN